MLLKLNTLKFKAMNQHEEQLTDFAYGIPIIHKIDELAEAWRSGAVDALAFYITLNRLEKAISELKDESKPYAIEHSMQWHEKSFSYFGATIEKKSSAGRWDYKGIRAWTEAKANLTAIEERAKAAYQASQKFGMQSATADGEEIELPTYTAGSEIIAIKGI